MSNERRDEGHKMHKAKLIRILGEADRHADKDVRMHEKTKPHLKPAQIAAIADHEIEMKGTPKKKRLDRPGRKKGGRSGKGDVNIIIGQKPEQPMMPPQSAMPPMMPPPRPPMMPPQGAMPPAPSAGGMPPGVMPPGAPGGAAGIPSQLMRKKGGRAEHPDTDYDYGAGGGLGRLEKIAKYGARK